MVVTIIAPSIWNIWKEKKHLDSYVILFIEACNLLLILEVRVWNWWKVYGREFNVATYSMPKLLKSAALNSVQGQSVNTYIKELGKVITELPNSTFGTSLKTDGNSGELIMVIKGSIYLKCTKNEPRNYLPGNVTSLPATNYPKINLQTPLR